jgi:heme-degrading monooxygenase HmoA
MSFEATVLRSWTGWIRSADREPYREYLERTGLREYRDTPGNIGAVLLYRDVDDDRTEVRTLSLWRSREDIVAFAGPNIEVAVFYPEDDHYLIDRRTTVEHFDVPWFDLSTE